VRNGGPYAKDGPHDGLWVAFSPDGIHWTNYEGNPVIKKYSDTNQVVLHDPRLKRYVAFGRFGFGRRLARTESEDFVHWTEPKLVLACDAADGPNTQIYGAGVDLYEGVYVGMIWIYREGGDAKIDTQLATSRDGIHWTRVGDRAMWLALGDEDSWEGGMVRSVERIIRRGDKLYIYYCGVHGPHGRPGFPPVQRQHPVQIGLVTQRRDGFVSLDAGEQPGTVTTKPFTLPAGHLHLNVEGPQGEVRVALLDLDAKTLGQSASITGNQLRAAVKWDVRPPRQPQGRLRFTLRQARLYAYWFE
jgi:hypothetical protein